MNASDMAVISEALQITIDSSMVLGGLLSVFSFIAGVMVGYLPTYKLKSREEKDYAN